MLPYPSGGSLWCETAQNGQMPLGDGRSAPPVWGLSPGAAGPGALSDSQQAASCLHRPRGAAFLSPRVVSYSLWSFPGVMRCGMWRMQGCWERPMSCLAPFTKVEREAPWVEGLVEKYLEKWNAVQKKIVCLGMVSYWKQGGFIPSKGRISQRKSREGKGFPETETTWAGVRNVLRVLRGSLRATGHVVPACIKCRRVACPGRGVVMWGSGAEWSPPQSSS